MSAPLARGDVVSCAAGDLHVVWGVSLGVVHCLPCYQRASRGVAAQFEDGSPMFVIAADRRHFPAAGVRRLGRLRDTVPVETAVRDVARQEAYRAAEKRRGNIIRAAAFRERQRATAH